MLYLLQSSLTTLPVIIVLISLYLPHHVQAAAAGAGREDVLRVPQQQSCQERCGTHPLVPCAHHEPRWFQDGAQRESVSALPEECLWTVWVDR